MIVYAIVGLRLTPLPPPPPQSPTSLLLVIWHFATFARVLYDRSYRLEMFLYLKHCAGWKMVLRSVRETEGLQKLAYGSTVKLIVLVLLIYV